MAVNDRATARRYWLTTLGCPKSEVDSEKLVTLLAAEGLTAADGPESAELVVVNTCAFIDAARQESIDTILAMQDAAAPGAQVVVTGCMAQRYEAELADALDDVVVAPFGVEFWGAAQAAAAPSGPTSSPTPIALAAPTRRSAGRSLVPTFDLLNLPRARSARPWAYVKIAEGCDRACGFCAIPSFRGPQRSRTVSSIVEEIDTLCVNEIVLVAQDLARYGKDRLGRPEGAGDLADLLAAASSRVDWVRLLYLYPSDLDDSLIDSIASSAVPYFDLSLQHVSRPLLHKMRRWGSGEVFRERIERIRELAPDATLRSNFIVGYPGESEDDHEALVQFVSDVGLDWCGFFVYSREEGTYAASLPDVVPPAVMNDRLAELRDIQESITFQRRAQRVGTVQRVLVDEPGIARSAGEAPEIDGVIHVPQSLAVGAFHDVRIVECLGVDLQAVASSSREGSTESAALAPRVG